LKKTITSLSVFLATETEFRDIDDKTYVVDFNKMEEYVKGETNSKTVVGVIRKDTAEGLH
jgi:hypothetical protein